MDARDGMTLPWDSLAELVPEASKLVLAAPYIKEGTLSDLLSLTGGAYLADVRDPVVAWRYSHGDFRRVSSATNFGAWRRLSFAS